jgi:hypothetical protein
MTVRFRGADVAEFLLDTEAASRLMRAERRAVTACGGLVPRPYRFPASPWLSCSMARACARKITPREMRGGGGIPAKSTLSLMAAWAQARETSTG